MTDRPRSRSTPRRIVPAREHWPAPYLPPQAADATEKDGPEVHRTQEIPVARAAITEEFPPVRPDAAASVQRAAEPHAAGAQSAQRAPDAQRAPSGRGKATAIFRRASDDPAPDARRSETTRSEQRMRRGMSVSTQVMVALTVIATVGLVLATWVFWWSEDRVRDQQIDADLAQEVETLRTLAGARDPATGEPFTSVDALLATFVTRNVPSEQEGFLVLIDGTVPFLPPFADRLEVENLAPVVEVATGVGPTDQVQQHEVVANGDEIRFVTVPVSVAGDPAHGVMVVATNVSASHEDTGRARTAQAFILVGTVILIGIAAALVTSRLLRPLGQLSETADRITEEDLSLRIPETGSDDIAQITRTVNSMLDRLEVAFQGQRELLDDVGHELRTPLTVIRGQLEVMDVDDPADVKETRELVLDESDRMARLVEELVLLAKSMRPDFVTLRPMAMDDVVHALFERSQVLAERRWRLDNLSGVEVEADAQRLLQAGLQLAANAVRHTNPEDEIGIGAGVDGDLVRLWVRDTGDGVPAAEQQGIFARAVRGSSARSGAGPAPEPPVSGQPGPQSAAASDTSSSGLGLSIVSAIAQAHGGRATLASTAGAGSTFAIEVPLRACGDGVLTDTMATTDTTNTTTRAGGAEHEENGNTR